MQIVCDTEFAQACTMMIKKSKVTRQLVKSFPTNMDREICPQHIAKAWFYTTRIVKLNLVSSTPRKCALVSYTSY